MTAEDRPGGCRPPVAPPVGGEAPDGVAGEPGRQLGFRGHPIRELRMLSPESGVHRLRRPLPAGLVPPPEAARRPAHPRLDRPQRNPANRPPAPLRQHHLRRFFCQRPARRLGPRRRPPSRRIDGVRAGILAILRPCFRRVTGQGFSPGAGWPCESPQGVSTPLPFLASALAPARLKPRPGRALKRPGSKGTSPRTTAEAVACYTTRTLCQGMASHTDRRAPVRLRALASAPQNC